MPNEKTNENDYVKSLKIPLIVGVTGHKDILTPEETIRKQMECFWERLQEAAGPETEIILLSSIAEGADHLAVKYRPKNVKYCVVLPFDENEYRKKFETETARADFEADLKGAYKKINCKGKPGDYTLASDYVRKHSDVLLTLWDGYETLDGEGKVKHGGTYYQIREAFGLDHLRPPQEKVHLIVNLPVKRAEDHAPKPNGVKEERFSGFLTDDLSVIERVEREPEKPDLIFTSFSKYDFGKRPSKSGLSFFAELLSFLCKFLAVRSKSEAEPGTSFREVLEYIRKHNESDFPKGPDEIKYYLRKTEKRDENGNVKKDKDGNICYKGMDCHPAAMEIVKADFNRHEYFDDKAGSHQKAHRKQFFWIAVLSIIVGVLGVSWGGFEFGSDPQIHEWIMHIVILLYLVFAIGGFLLWINTEREDHYTKYLDPRIIAELLRLKMFWTLAGIGIEVDDDGCVVIRNSFTEMIFDESASYQFMVPILNWEIADESLSGKDREWLEKGEGFAAVKECWLDDQADYYYQYLLPDDPKHFFLPQNGEPCNRKTFLSVDWFKKYFQLYERGDGYARCLKTICTLGGFIFAFFLIVIFLSAKVCKIDHKGVLGIYTYREFAVAICLFGGAMLGWLMEKKKWGDLGRQYRNAWKRFTNAGTFFGDGDKDVEIKRQIIKELVVYAHDENAEWQDIRKNAKPEPLI